ncbi:MAG: hypothetical protein M0Z81_07630 [Deltaproteobacteria bacterium]|nr:hypothetical protein [Deltaproteobacteria bacterium]
MSAFSGFYDSFPSTENKDRPQVLRFSTSSWTKGKYKIIFENHSLVIANQECVLPARAGKTDLAATNVLD